MTLETNRDTEPPTRPSYYGQAYGYDGMAGRDGDLDGGFSLTDIIGIVKRRWELLAVCMVIGTLAAAVWGYLQPTTYQATAKLLIEPDQRVVDLDSVVEGVGSDSAAIETQLNLLKSNGFLEDFVKAQSSTGTARDRALQQIEKMKDFVNAKPKAIEAAIAGEISATTSSEDESLAAAMRAAEIADNLNVVQSGRSFIINVAYTSTDPIEAARTANEVAEFYIADQAKRRRQVTGNASDALETRLKELEAELLAAEEAVHQYRANHPTVATGQLSTTNERLSNITSILANARADRKEKEVRLEYIKRLQRGGGNLGSLTEVLSSPYMASLWQEESQLRAQETELRLELGARHPKIIALNEERAKLTETLDTEINKIVDNISNELKVLQERERSLEEDVEELTAAANESDSSHNYATIRLRLLEGKAETSRRIYEDFLLRFKETREQEAIVQANTRVIASAKIPTIPSSSSPTRFALLGFIGSSALGFGLAYLIDRSDRKLRTNKEITQGLGIPCLGMVPYLSDKVRKERKFHEYLEEKPASRFAEALRSIYTKLIINHSDDTPLRVVQITSSMPDEGKTTFAINLATMLALDGRKTLLLDFDLRNPSVHREINLDDTLSLEGFLRGKKPLGNSMVAIPETGCHVAAVKSAVKDPGKLLRSQNVSNLIEFMRDRYDFIIIDGPPSLGLSDSKALLSLIDSIVFIVRWNNTTTEQASEAIEELQNCNAKISGAVLTQVDLKQQNRYGYAGSEAYYGKSKEYYKE